MGAPVTAGIGGNFSSIAVTYTGTPGGTVRLQVNVGTTNYCVNDYASGTVVQASSLTQDCYNPGGEQLPSLAQVNQVVLSIVSSTQEEVFTNFCMTSITLQ